MTDIDGKKRFFEEFFGGTGPFPLIFARPHLALDRNYHKYDLISQHSDVSKLIEDNLMGARATVNRVDDGIPTVRADLGTTLIPSAFGLPLHIGENAHPSLKEHLDTRALLTIIEQWDAERVMNGEVVTAFGFYESISDGLDGILPYVPDTQGVFDLAHLLLGEEIFLLPYDDPDLTDRILDFCVELFVSATWRFKNLLGEQPGSMVHGHGMTRGVWFPHCGARISEDSATLLSPEMVARYCVPRVARALAPFGLGFLHFCGHRPDVLRAFCEIPEVAVVNLGNPELYDLDEVCSVCGSTGTILFQHFDMQDGETYETYLERLADVLRRHGARCILIAPDCPQDREDQTRVVEMWHRLTAPDA
jgi:hypothetical protein